VQIELQKEASAILTTMMANMQMTSLRGMAYALHKVWKLMYDKIIVSEGSIARLKQHAGFKGCKLYLDKFLRASYSLPYT
jgi:hypothetical protein